MRHPGDPAGLSHGETETRGDALGSSGWSPSASVPPLSGRGRQPSSDPKVLPPCTALMWSPPVLTHRLGQK